MIDINCDMGEGIGNDADLMPLINSANIACGFHAGDVDIMRICVGLALQHQVKIGAHPSFNDRKNFGRSEFHLTENEVYDLVIEQLIIFNRVVLSEGGVMYHVKPHGALYNMAARDERLSHNIAKAVNEFNSNLVLYGLSGSYLITEAEKIGLKTLNEVFADRAYNDDGSLVSRSQPGALIKDEEQALKQVKQMVEHGTVTTISGTIKSIRAETVCIHSDGSHAVAFAKRLSGFIR